VEARKSGAGERRSGARCRERVGGDELLDAEHAPAIGTASGTALALDVGDHLADPGVVLLRRPVLVARQRTELQGFAGGEVVLGDVFAVLAGAVERGAVGPFTANEHAAVVKRAGGGGTGPVERAFDEVFLETSLGAQRVSLALPGASS
jgi:hypothetical protein